jgi:hypothetical protein
MRVSGGEATKKKGRATGENPRKKPPFYAVLGGKNLGSLFFQTFIFSLFSLSHFTSCKNSDPLDA